VVYISAPHLVNCLPYFLEVNVPMETAVNLTLEPSLLEKVAKTVEEFGKELSVNDQRNMMSNITKPRVIPVFSTQASSQEVRT